MPGGLPQIGGLLGVGFVLQTQVLDARDKEALPGPERAWGPIASFFRNRNFQYQEAGQGLKASLCLLWEGGPQAQAET